MDFFSDKNNKNNKDEIVVDATNDKTKIEHQNSLNPTTINWMKIFGILALCVFATGVLGFFYTPLTLYIAGDNENLYQVILIGTLIFSIVATIAGSFMISLKAFSKKIGTSIAGLVLLVLGFSTMLSPIIYLAGGSEVIIGNLAVNPIYLAFIITAVAFVILGLLGTFIKNIGGFALFLSAFGSCLMLLILVNYLMIAFSYNSFTLAGGAASLFWMSTLIDGLLLLYMLAVTCYDFAVIKKMNDSGAISEYPSFTIYAVSKLYADFVYIFIRVLIIILANSSRRN